MFHHCFCKPDILELISKTFYLGDGYLQLMTIIGALLCSLELQVVYANKSELPPTLKRGRLRGTLLSSYQERTVKFYTNIFTICLYIALNQGITQENFLLCLPWFIVQTFVIIGEIFIFYLTLFRCTTVNISSRNLLSSLFVLLNWSQVFFFLHQLNSRICI